ncbi:hypothetical protein BDV96DRAFT_649413 [Lophiotrema nucula]|uniref:AAA+ ATPase domain-containing protein n=1 Tax=Lophiotrema nucula TaxID=690887 RepID=A0A6A5YY68_9PLEO|nr:hypothetical protein BDV96DRAFT_649413 [Lophiotrema nucula]
MAGPIKFPILPNLHDFFESSIVEDIFFEQEGLFDKLDDALPDCAGSGLKSIALCGPAGVGKTRHVREYVNKRGQRFDAVLRISLKPLPPPFNDPDDPCKRSTNFSDSYLKASGELHLGVNINSNEGEDKGPFELGKPLPDALVQWLKCPKKTSDDEQSEMAKWLVIFEDVVDPDHLRPLLPILCDGCVLVTTQNPQVRDLKCLSAPGINVGPLPIKKGVEYLKKHVYERLVEEKGTGFPSEAKTQYQKILQRIQQD